MSADASPPDPSTVQQFGAAAGVALAAAFGAVWQWLRGAREKGDGESKIVLEALELADMSSVREVAALMRDARDIVPLVREAIKSLAELHGKRDRADATVAAMHGEFAASLARIEARLQTLEVELRVLVRIGGERG